MAGHHSQQTVAARSRGAEFQASGANPPSLFDPHRVHPGDPEYTREIHPLIGGSHAKRTRKAARPKTSGRHDQPDGRNLAVWIIEVVFEKYGIGARPV